MTSIRDLVSETMAVGETFCLEVEKRDDVLVASHPYDACPMDVAVVEELDRLDSIPPAGPIEVEIVGRIVDNRIAGRVVSPRCDDPRNTSAGDDMSEDDDRRGDDELSEDDDRRGDDDMSEDDDRRRDNEIE